ncbi:MAG TPA: thiamine pyrophosphate-dependent dehydrogenase E1 component subunit alpha [Bryobacteraceae bacterium]|nr:thiamine pyrophosphate-dependent dehydrogenase E1 component subunit alpha [Bryobacteraceae bacterium]
MSATQAIPTGQREEAALAHKCLYYMSLMREMEDRIERKLYRQGKVLGGVYVGRGQEAISTGVALVAQPDDVLFPSHRDMAAFLIRGFSPGRIFAQYMGRMDGATRGRDGNMHMGDLNHKIVPIVSALAATVPVAAGAAMALKYKGSRNVAICWFGEGSTSLGHWHEGINLASVQKAPVLWICNNNQYAYSTPLRQQMACANVADKGPGYGLPAEIVDGNDVLAVHEAARRALEFVRSANGPYLIECKTFRMTGHSAHDNAHYVPPELFEEWSKRDPIKRLEARMAAEGWAEPEEIESLHAAILKEVDEALAFAEASPLPDPATLTDGVYESQ